MNNLKKAKKALFLENFGKVIYSSETAKEKLEIPYRKLSAWDKKGVLPSQKKYGEKGWRTFSFYDLFIIQLVLLLRDKNIPISNIKEVYFNISNENEIVNVINDSLCIGEKMYFATDLNGRYSILPENDIDKILEMCRTSLIIFNLNKIFQELKEKLKS